MPKNECLLSSEAANKHIPELTHFWQFRNLIKILIMARVGSRRTYFRLKYSMAAFTRANPRGVSAMSTRNEVFGVILGMSVAVGGFLLVIGANNYVWPQGDCEGTYYLDPGKPFSSPVMQIDEGNYDKQCGRYVTAPDPHSKVGETLLGGTVYGGSNLSNSGPCREYENCKAALDVRTLESIGDLFRLSILSIVLGGIVIGTFFAGVAIVDASGASSSGAIGFYAISYLTMVAASTVYLANYYWSIGDFGYPVAVLISIAGFVIFLFFFFVLKGDLTESFKRSFRVRQLRNKRL
jgi:hypothetical protein